MTLKKQSSQASQRGAESRWKVGAYVMPALCLRHLSRRILSALAEAEPRGAGTSAETFAPSFLTLWSIRLSYTLTTSPYSYKNQQLSTSTSPKSQNLNENLHYFPRDCSGAPLLRLRGTRLRLVRPSILYFSDIQPHKLRLPSDHGSAL